MGEMAVAKDNQVNPAMVADKVSQDNPVTQVSQANQLPVTVMEMVTAAVKASQVNRDSHLMVTVPVTVMVTATANPVTQVSQETVTATVPETVTEMVPVTVTVMVTGQVMEPVLVQGIFSLGI